MKLKALLLFFLFFFFSSTIDCYGESSTIVDKQNFLKAFKQNCSAVNQYDSNTGVQLLTPYENSYSGNIAFQKPIDVTSAFKFDGAIYSGGADGLGICFYPSIPNQISGTGGNVGVYGISNSFGWKLDTFLNDSNYPFNGNITGELDDGLQVPYGILVTTDENGYGKLDKSSYRYLGDSLKLNTWYDFEVSYVPKTTKLSIKLFLENRKEYEFSKELSLDSKLPYFFSISASTSMGEYKQQMIRFDSFEYQEQQTATFKFVDNTTNNILKEINLYGLSGTFIKNSNDYDLYYNTLNNLLNEGYQLVTNEFNDEDKFDNDSSTSQIYEIHLEQTYQLEKTEIYQYLTYPLNKSSDVIGSISECAVEYNVMNKPIAPYHQYPDYSLEINIPDGLNVKSSKVLNEEGVDVTDQYFSRSQSDNSKNVKYVAKQAALKNKDFYDHVYTLVVTNKLENAGYLDKLIQQDAVTFTTKGTAKVKNLVENTESVSSKIFKRNITVKHIDSEDNNKLLKEETYKKYDGEAYEFFPLDNLFKIINGKKYQYKSSTVHKGIVKGENLDLEIPYIIPTLNMSINKILIDTDTITSKGLPLKIDFDKKTNTSEFLKNLELKISMINTSNNQTVFEEVINQEKMNKEIEGYLDVSGENKNSKLNYKLVIEVQSNPDNNYCEIKGNNTVTYGYTASESIFDNQSMKNNTLKYKAVIRTVKDVQNNQPVKELYETVNLRCDLNIKTKTGYGVPINISMDYTNDLGKSINLNSKLKADSTLVDLKHNDSKKTNMTTIKMETVNNSISKDHNKIIQNLKLALPKMNVEKYTGEVSINTSDINSKAVVSGGRNLYIPIWHSLGNYEVFLNSNKFGTNQFSFDLTNHINIYAQMISSMDSKTVKQDEIMLVPIYPDSYSPSDWTEKELNWLKE